MNDINKIIENLYNAYVKKDLALMEKLLNEGKVIDENNPYLKKYEGLYEKLKNSDNGSSKEEKVIKFGGKTIKCPHCGGNLAMSEKNNKVIENAKAFNTQNLNFSCTYCKTDFIWNNLGIKPLYLEISVGNEIVIDNKKYKVSGGVRYTGKWKTNGVGRLEYIERILIDEKGDTYYLSESKSWWNEGGESGVEHQTEISRKIVPNFNLGELNEISINIDGKEQEINEICEVNISEVYGENSKSYTIGESIKTYQLRYKGKDYVFEKEESLSQKEIGVYHTWEVNDKKLRSGGFSYNDYALNKFSNDKHILLKVFLFLAIAFFSFSYFGCERTIKYVTLNDISNKELSEVKGLYKVKFSEIYKKDISESTKRYDYGGIKHTIKYLDGIKFRVKTQEDLDILKKILSGELDIKSQQIPEYTLDFTEKTFSSYFTQNEIINYK